MIKNILFLKICVLLSVFCFSQSKSTEDDTTVFEFPMKGDFIYYNLEHSMSNSKHDVNYYLNFNNSDFYQNFITKSINNFSFKFSASKAALKCFISPPLIGENGTLNVNLPVGFNLLESNLLYSLITIKKFKITSERIDATIKLEVNSENSYSLIFTNFLITYGGNEGGASKFETLDLEEVYNELKNKQTLDNKMYDKTAKNLQDVDRLVKEIDALFFKELDKVIRMDN
jgi:hypothetical protein